MTFKHILIPTDGSKLSEHAAQAAVELAAALGARVTALFVAPPATPLVFDGILPVGYASPDEHADAIARAGARFLGAIEKTAIAAGVAFEGASVTGDYAAEAIVQAAKERHCDLIVMASHGRRGIAAALLGSETQKVLTQSKVPVLVHR